MDSFPSQGHQHEGKHKQLNPVFELESLIPFPLMITVTVSAAASMIDRDMFDIMKCLSIYL